MQQLQIDFYQGTRFCIVCGNEVNEQWAIERQKKGISSDNWVCSNCWNNMHYTKRKDMLSGKIQPKGLFRNAKKTHSKDTQTKQI